MKYDINKIQYYFFTFFVIFSYIVTALFITGLNNNGEFYLETLNSYVKIYISLYLILRFNIFRHVKFTELDRKIVYTAGVFLFSTTIIYNIILNYIKEIKYYIKSLL
jgi:hypothetical protein